MCCKNKYAFDSLTFNRKCLDAVSFFFFLTYTKLMIACFARVEKKNCNRK